MAWPAAAGAATTSHRPASRAAAEGRPHRTPRTRPGGPPWRPQRTPRRGIRRWRGAPGVSGRMGVARPLELAGADGHPGEGGGGGRAAGARGGQGADGEADHAEQDARQREQPRLDGGVPDGALARGGGQQGGVQPRQLAVEPLGELAGARVPGGEGDLGRVLDVAEGLRARGERLVDLLAADLAAKVEGVAAGDGRDEERAEVARGAPLADLE